MPVRNRLKAAKSALGVLVHDRDNHLLKIDRYERGVHDDPYMPDSADAEYRLHAKRAVTNITPFIVTASAQNLYVDSFRRGYHSGLAEDAIAGTFGEVGSTDAVQPEWDHWQRSRMDARQAAVYRGAFKYGHSFVLTEKDKKGEVVSKGLSALNTIAMYDDAANDDAPAIALTVTKWPKDKEHGTARMWDDTYEYEVRFKSEVDLSKGISVTQLRAHGAEECPVTRFVVAVDLEGRTVGLIEPLIPLQDRLNQTVFDLLVVQSYSSFKVRTVSGMAPPVKLRAVDENGETVDNPKLNEDKVVDWVPVIDANTGRPVPDDIQLSAKRIFWAEDNDTKFGTLEETPLNGFIAAIEMGFQHISALTQTPPHHLLGKVANLSGDALVAAEAGLIRKVEEFKASFGESWERVFRIAAQIGGYEGKDDFHGEVVWRDMGQKSMSQHADALGKLGDGLEIPKRGLWKMVPGVTANQLKEWDELYREENVELAMSNAIRPAGTRPQFRQTGDVNGNDTGSGS